MDYDFILACQYKDTKGRVLSFITCHAIFIRITQVNQDSIYKRKSIIVYSSPKIDDF